MQLYVNTFTIANMFIFFYQYIYSLVQDFDEIIKRFNYLKEHLGLSDSALGRACEVSHGAIAHLLKGKAKSFDVIYALKLYQNLKVNPNWLIAGVGKMIDNDAGFSYLNEPNPEYWKNLKEESEVDRPLLTKYSQLQDDLIGLQKEFIEIVKENRQLRLRISELDRDPNSTSGERRGA